MSDTRIPTQKRSIEKKHRIVEKGFELICEKGFYNTNYNVMKNEIVNIIKNILNKNT